MADTIKILVCRCEACGGTVACETISDGDGWTADEDDFASVGAMVVDHSLRGDRISIEHEPVSIPTCRCPREAPTHE